MTFKLFIDDERKAPAEYTHHAPTVGLGMVFLAAAQRDGEEFELVSFDYDAHSRLGWTFEALAWFLKDNNFWPKEIRIHTANWWTGRPWFEKFFAEHAPATTKIDLTDPWDFDINYATAAPWVRELLEAQR